MQATSSIDNNAVAATATTAAVTPSRVDTTATATATATVTISNGNGERNDMKLFHHNHNKHNDTTATTATNGGTSSGGIVRKQQHTVNNNGVRRTLTPPPPDRYQHQYQHHHNNAATASAATTTKKRMRNKPPTPTMAELLDHDLQQDMLELLGYGPMRFAPALIPPDFTPMQVRQRLAEGSGNQLGDYVHLRLRLEAKRKKNGLKKALLTDAQLLRMVQFCHSRDPNYFILANARGGGNSGHRAYDLLKKCKPYQFHLTALDRQLYINTEKILVPIPKLQLLKKYCLQQSQQQQQQQQTTLEHNLLNSNFNIHTLKAMNHAGSQNQQQQPYYLTSRVLYFRPSRFYPKKYTKANVIDTLIYILDHWTQTDAVLLAKHSFTQPQPVTYCLLINLVDFDYHVHFTKDYWSKFMAVLQGKVFPVKIGVVLWVDPPPSFDAKIWNITKQMMIDDDFASRNYKITSQEFGDYFESSSSTNTKNDDNNNNNNNNTQPLSDVNETDGETKDDDVTHHPTYNDYRDYLPVDEFPEIFGPVAVVTVDNNNNNADGNNNIDNPDDDNDNHGDDDYDGHNNHHNPINNNNNNSNRNTLEAMANDYIIFQKYLETIQGKTGTLLPEHQAPKKQHQERGRSRRRRFSLPKSIKLRRNKTKSRDRSRDRSRDSADQQRQNTDVSSHHSEAEVDEDGHVAKADIPERRARSLSVGKRLKNRRKKRKEKKELKQRKKKGIPDQVVSPASSSDPDYTGIANNHVMNHGGGGDGDVFDTPPTKVLAKRPQMVKQKSSRRNSQPNSVVRRRGTGLIGGKPVQHRNPRRSSLSVLEEMQQENSSMFMAELANLQEEDDDDPFDASRNSVGNNNNNNSQNKSFRSNHSNNSNSNLDGDLVTPSHRRRRRLSLKAILSPFKSHGGGASSKASKKESESVVSDSGHSHTDLEASFAISQLANDLGETGISTPEHTPPRGARRRLSHQRSNGKPQQQQQQQTSSNMSLLSFSSNKGHSSDGSGMNLESSSSNPEDFESNHNINYLEDSFTTSPNHKSYDWDRILHEVKANDGSPIPTPPVVRRASAVSRPQSRPRRHSSTTFESIVKPPPLSNSPKRAPPSAADGGGGQKQDLTYFMNQVQRQKEKTRRLQQQRMAAAAAAAAAEDGNNDEP